MNSGSEKMAGYGWCFLDLIGWLVVQIPYVIAISAIAATFVSPVDSVVAGRVDVGLIDAAL